VKSEVFKILWIVFVVIVLLVVVLFAFAFFSIRSLDKEYNSGIQRRICWASPSRAYAAAKEFVTAELNTSSNVLFLRRLEGHEVKITGGLDCVHEVTGYVSLESETEGTRRKNFYVRLQDGRDFEKFLLLDLRIE
jgi:hypothetical protein